LALQKPCRAKLLCKKIFDFEREEAKYNQISNLLVVC